MLFQLISTYVSVQVDIQSVVKLLAVLACCIILHLYT